MSMSAGKRGMRTQYRTQNHDKEKTELLGEGAEEWESDTQD